LILTTPIDFSCNGFTINDIWNNTKHIIERLIEIVSAIATIATAPARTQFQTSVLKLILQYSHSKRILIPEAWLQKISNLT
jgi:hypothetical protein